jgi:hypothetical protein
MMTMVMTTMGGKVDDAGFCFRGCALLVDYVNEERLLGKCFYKKENRRMPCNVFGRR